MAIQAYLNFDGNTREAVHYYAEVFGSPAPRIMTFGEMPADPNFVMPEEVKNRVLHAEVEISGSIVMFSDTMPGTPLTVGNNLSLAVVTGDRDLIASAYRQLRDDGGEVEMELQETFWSPMYGIVRDRYGVIWQFSLQSGEAMR